jgi:hypothetical protein
MVHTTVPTTHTTVPTIHTTVPTTHTTLPTTPTTVPSPVRSRAPPPSPAEGHCSIRSPPGKKTPRRRGQCMTGGWDPSAQSEGSKSEQVRQRMDLEHCLHWLHLEPTHLIYYTVCTGYTRSPLTWYTTLSALATLGAHSPDILHCLHWLH